MPISTLQNGVYQFSTVNNTSDSINVVSGTSDPFNRNFYGGITLYTGSSDFVNGAVKNVETIKNYGVIRNNGLYAYQLQPSSTSGPYVNGDSVATSSLDTETKLLEKGSLLIVNGTANHHIILPDPVFDNVDGYVFRIFKNNSGTNSITINPTSTAKINGALTKTSTDAWCSIELVASGYGPAGWCILSSTGTWT